MQDIFKAMADPTRREIISILIQQDLTVKEVNQRINIPDSTLSHHLEILYRSGLVSKRRAGTFIFYSASLSVLEEFIAFISIKFTKTN
ncbi:ArsR/SmtB family transcription factor [Paenibacillus sp. TY11]|uniref:ArsR/SmtB family transcription factor n=1 Tax=Paenibacillus sp. TY11 TaxID=3448633 RepID=UPI00403A31AB